jgi:XTP/dITP diphosphohydrolase
VKDLVFITGNQHKAKYLALWLGIDVPHQKVDLDEVQSLDLREVVEHKARLAYEIVGRPVLVEDVALRFAAMGRLPGTFIRWFLEELGIDGLCRLGNNYENKSAEATIMYGLYDGHELHVFEGSKTGRLASEPRGDSFGWNNIFVPDGWDKTYGEMTDDEFKACSHRYIAIDKLRAYLQKT